MSAQTYQVSASATKPQTVRPPFEARSVSASNNAGVNVTVSDDHGGSFTLSPGQTKTQGYRSAPGSWTITATSDGPGSVALTLSSDYAPGDATPQNVSQRAAGNQYFALTNASSIRRFDTSGVAEALLGVSVVSFTQKPFALVLTIDENLASQVSLPNIAIPSAPLWFAVRLGRSSRGPIGTKLSVSSNAAGTWVLDCYLALYGG